MNDTRLKDYYGLLGVTKLSTNEEIKKAFRIKAKQFHPDVNNHPNAHKMFCEIGEAYEVLNDSGARKSYDDLLKKMNAYSQQEAPKEHHNYYNKDVNEEFAQTQRRAQSKANEYTNMSLEKLINSILGFSYEVGRAVLIGERDKPSLNIFAYIGLGFKGVMLTMCIIISFTGVGTIPGIIEVIWRKRKKTVLQRMKWLRLLRNWHFTPDSQRHGLFFLWQPKYITMMNLLRKTYSV